MVEEEDKELKKRIAATLFEELFRLSPLIQEAKQAVLDNTRNPVEMAMEPSKEANERCARLRDYKAQYEDLNSLFKRLIEDLKPYREFIPDLGVDIDEDYSKSHKSMYFYLYTHFLGPD